MKNFLNRERGFTFVEVLVAQVILTIGTMALWSVFVTGSRYNSESENRTVATNVAQYVMEETIEDLMASDFENVAATGEVLFASRPQELPFWTIRSTDMSHYPSYQGSGTEEEWMVSLPTGVYEVSYPDGVNADPLGILVTVAWQGNPPWETSLDMHTQVSRKQ